jgi:amino acid transporter
MNIPLVGAVITALLVAYFLYRGVAGALKFTLKIALWAVLAVGLIAGVYFFGQGQQTAGHPSHDPPTVQFPSHDHDVP